MRQRQRGYAIIEAPSVLGLFPGGVEGLPEALLQAGLADALRARLAGRVPPPPYDPERDLVTGLLNPTGLREFSHQLADATGDVLDGGEIPILLGGDCSILLGALLALRRRGRYGLLFIDGHADFYQPEAEPNGEAASMDLALATGRGPRVVADLEGRAPLVRDEDVVLLGRRDAWEAEGAGSQRIEDTGIAVFDLAAVRERGARQAAADTLERLCRPDLDGFWLHLDCDVVDDALMPAVDYRLPGGLSWEELQAVVGMATNPKRRLGRARGHHFQSRAGRRRFDRPSPRRLRLKRPHRPRAPVGVTLRDSNSAASAPASANPSRRRLKSTVLMGRVGCEGGRGFLGCARGTAARRSFAVRESPPPSCRRLA